MVFYSKLNMVVSLDTSGMIEMWDASTYQFPDKKLDFELISDTDFLLAAEDGPVLSMSLASSRGVLVLTNSKSIFFFDLKSGKILKER